MADAENMLTLWTRGCQLLLLPNLALKCTFDVHS